MYPVGQPIGGPGPIGQPPSSMNQQQQPSQPQNTNSFGTGALGPMITSSSSSTQLGGLLVTSDQTQIGSSGLSSPSLTGAAALISTATTGNSGTAILPLGSLGPGKNI